MNILALDLGTHTGYCHTNEAGGTVSGTWDLGSAKEITAWGKDRLTRRRDPRVLRLFANLRVVSPAPDVVVFEDVQFSTYTWQTQLWASFRAAVWLAFGAPTVVECVPVTTLKMFATGSGGADKTAMAKCLVRRFPEFRGVKMDDNEVDAIWIYKWAKTNLSRMAI